VPFAIYDKVAPPPVDIKLILFSCWNFFAAFNASPPPTIFIAFVSPVIRSISWVPFENSSFSYIPNEFKKPQVILADGSSIIFGIHENCAERTDYCVTIGVDVNGIKKPNTVGRDVFSFNIYPQVNRFMPGGTYKAPYDSETGKFYERSPDEIRELCSEVKRSSWNCAARIIIDGFKMNY